MSMTEGQVYVCQNPDCRREVGLRRAAVEPNSNPRCLCGAEMKKPYKKPVLRTRDIKPELHAASGTCRR
jgi:hypothetical protein